MLGLDVLGMMLDELDDRVGTAPLDVAEQVLCLVFELIEVGTDGKVTCSHDEPPRVLPGVRWFGQRRFVRTGRHFVSVRWTRSYPRTGGVLHAAASIPRSMRTVKTTRIGGDSLEMTLL